MHTSPDYSAFTFGLSWVIPLTSFLLGSGMMAFTLGFAYTCEENIFEMWHGKTPDNPTSTA